MNLIPKRALSHQRKLVSIRRIQAITPIPNSTQIECCIVDGWKVVTKKGEFRVGDLAVFCEIDSWVPSRFLPARNVRHKPNTYKGVQGWRVRTTKIRGQVSQGLLLPSNLTMNALKKKFPKIQDFSDLFDHDLSEALGVIKWEHTAPISSSGDPSRSPFPMEVPRTDQERVQNIVDKLQSYCENKLCFEVTEKLDGASCTIYLSAEGSFHVCSRRVSLRPDDSEYWTVVKQNNLKKKMETLNMHGYALQGEVIGPKIQGNRYALPALQLYIYDVFTTTSNRFLDPKERMNLCRKLDVKHVPVIHSDFTLTEHQATVDHLLQVAEGKSVLNPKVEREGLVFKTHHNEESVSFKTISNTYLLKGGC